MTTLLFDCDGVLAETERDGHRVAFNRAFERHGLPLHWDEATYGRLLAIGGGKERMRHALESDPSIVGNDPDRLDALVAALHADKTRIFLGLVSDGALTGRPGVRRVVAAAVDAGWTLAVCSTSAEASVRGVLDSAVGPELAGRFAGVFAGDVVSRKKPAPDVYRHAVAELGADAGEVAVVEDSGIGAAAAAAAGLGHLVTVSHYTADDDFGTAAVVVSSLGDDDAPARVSACALEPPPGALIGLDDLRRVAAAPAARAGRGGPG